MKIIGCGSRKMPITEFNVQEAQRILKTYEVSALIEGGASGGDRVWQMAASGLGIKVETRPAKWSIYGKSAGPIRNQEMLNEKPDKVFAFKPKHNDITRGTLDMISRAEKAGIECFVFEYEGEE